MTENISATVWQEIKTLLEQNRLLAQDVGVVLSGKSFTPIELMLPPNPRIARERSLEEMEMTMVEWMHNGE